MVAEVLIGLAVFGAASALFARTKGLDPKSFFLAGGPVGLGLLAVLPSPSKAGVGETARARREVGNRLGRGLSIATAIGVVLLILL